MTTLGTDTYRVVIVNKQIDGDGTVFETRVELKNSTKTLPFGNTVVLVLHGDADFLPGQPLTLTLTRDADALDSAPAERTGD